MNRKGFTLIELLVAIVIIGLVVGFSVFGIINLIKDSESKTVVISKENIMEAARIYSSEADSSSWKKNDTYDAFCVTVGELMNKGFIDEKGVISNKDIDKDTYVIVKRNNITYSNISEEIVSDVEGTEDSETCTGQSSNGEGHTAPVIGTSTNYTSLLKIPFSTGKADSGIKNYKCLYGESSSNVNKEGNIENNTCIVNNLKNNQDYYVLIYMNTTGGSSILATGDRNYKTSDFNETTFEQNKNVVTINYNNKDINGNNINNPSYYFSSDKGGLSDVELTECTLKKNGFACSAKTNKVKENTWYKASNNSVKITYPEENNKVNINARIYDGSNNYRNDIKEIVINKYIVKFYRNNVLNIDGNTNEYVEKYCITESKNTCSITSPSITPQIGYSVVGWNTSVNSTSSSWNVGVVKNINSNLEYYAISKINIVTIQYSANGADKIKSPAGGHNWILDNKKYNGLILQENNRSNFFTIKHGDSTSDYGLSDWNNPDFINVEKKGYHAEAGDEWKCLEGCTGTYSHSTKYVASDFCDSSYGDCAVVLGVNWAPNTFYIKFNGNGSTSGSMDNQKFTYDTSQNLTANKFEKAYTVTYNYNGNGNSNGTATATATFNGWATSATSSVVYGNMASVKNLITTGTYNLYAKWTNGSVTLPTPTRNGYTFNGWYTSASEGTKVGGGGANYTPSANITLYAKWIPNTFYIKFNGNGSTSGSMDNQTFTYGTSQNLTANAFKRAYTVTYNYNGSGTSNTSAVANATFSGWATSTTGSVVYADKASVKNLTTSGTYNLYAKWTSGSVTLPTAIRAGYSFGGWYTASSGGTKVGGDGEVCIPDKSITLYAKWSINNYELRIDPNGGNRISDGNTGLISVTKDYGSEEIISERARFGYTLTGYIVKNTVTGSTATADLGGAKFTFDSSAKTGLFKQGVVPITLVARWIPNTYKVTLDNQGATTQGTSAYWYQYNTTKEVNGETVYYWIDQGLSNPMKGYKIDIPTKNGYTFGGYYTGKNGTGTQYVDKDGICINNIYSSVAANTTLYAKWTPNTYTINYTLNGGSVSENPTSYTVNSNSITLNAPTRTGYTFIGWTGSNGTTPQTSVTISKGSTGNKNYTANWKANTYTISYTLNGGSVSKNPSEYTIESGAITLNAPTRTGYTFLGWTGSNGTTPQTSVTISKGSTGNKNYTANWSANKIKITFNANGGTVGTEHIWYYYGISKFYSDEACTKEITSIVRPTRFGYTYVSYCGDGSSGGNSGERYVAYENVEFASDLATDIYKDATLYAKWDIDTYTITYNKYNNLLSGLGDGDGSLDRMDYTVKDGIITVTAKQDDGYGYTDGRVTLEAGKTYVFSTYTNGTWPSQVEAFLMKDGKYDYYIHMGSNNYTFTPAHSGTYWLRLDVNNSGQTYMFSDIRISELGSMNLTYGSTYANLPTPTRMGLKFDGWYYNGTKVSNGTAATLANSDHRLEDRWIPETYTNTITHIVYGGNPYVEEAFITTKFTQAFLSTISFNSSLVTTAPEGTGFTHWGTGEIDALWGTGEHWDPNSSWVTYYSNDTSVQPNRNININAYYSAVKYNITYETNGGTNSSSNPSIYTVKDTITLKNPTRTGYTFEGWYTNSNFSGTAVTQIVKGSIGNKTFYAKWKANPNTAYKVEHWLQNIDAGDTQNNTNYTLKNTENLTGTTGASITPSVRAYTGFTSPSTQSTTILADGSTAIRYYYKRNSYTVTLNKGTGISSVTGAGTYDFGKTVTINAVVSDGYTWKNWTGDSTVTTQNYTFTMPSSGVNYNANATVNTYTITYNLNGGSLSVSNPGTYTVEFNTITLNAPTRIGYTFEGWYTNSNFSGTAVTQIVKGSIGNKTFYAKWEPNSYTYDIVYESSTGKLLGTSTATYNYGTTNTINPDSFTGYTTPTARPIKWDSVVAKTIVFEYTPEEYNIMYSITVQGNPKTYNIESDEIILKEPNLSGYNFIGWIGSNGDNPSKSVVIPTGSIGERTYIANWELISYNITYELNGGSVTGNPNNYTVQSDAITLNNPTKTGYTFVGWTGSNGSTPQITVKIPNKSTGDRKYTANWIDSSPPTCMLSVTESGITMSVNDNVGVTSSGMSTSSTPVYNNESLLTLSAGTKYGFVKDYDGNIGMCSVEIVSANTTVACSKAAAISYSNKSCSASNYSNPSSACSSGYTYGGNDCVKKTNKKWTAYYATCFYDESTKIYSWRPDGGLTKYGLSTCYEDVRINGPCDKDDMGLANASIYACTSTSSSTTYEGIISCYKYACTEGTYSTSDKKCYIGGYSSCPSGWNYAYSEYNCNSGYTRVGKYCYK